MARRHARPPSPYFGYNANNAYNNANAYQPYATPFYYQPPNPAPLPVYGQHTQLALPVTPFAGPYSFSPSPNQNPSTFFGNRAPLAEEMVALQHTLQMKEATISFLDAQIEAAKDNLDTLAIPYFDLRARFESAQSAYLAAKENHEDLLTQRGTLGQSMQHLTALLHPLRRVPPDILVRIFAFAVEAEMEKDYDRLEPPRLRKPQCIINITRVCSKWRSSAHRKPELWTYVRLNLSRRSHVHEKLQHFLNLADGLPMSITTSNLQPGFFGTSTDSEDDENGLGALPLLVPVKKLRSLTVNYTHYRALQYLPALGTKCLDTLEELHLRSEPLSSPASGLFSIASYLAEAPNLRVLRLMHVHLLPPQAHEAAPSVYLPKVQELVMHGPMTHGTEIFGFAQIVGMLPNVEKITFCQNDTVPFTVTDTIHLPKLRELTTNCVALETALRTSFGVQQVHAPKLSKLTVVDSTNLSGLGPGGPGGGGLAHFLNAVRSVQDLTIMGNFDPYTNIVTPLGPVPLLVQPSTGAVNIFPTNMPMVLPPPPMPMGFGIPLPQTLGLGGPAGTLGSTSTGGSLTFLKSLRDIIRMEIVNVHPRFVEALCKTRTVAGPSNTNDDDPEDGERDDPAGQEDDSMEDTGGEDESTSSEVVVHAIPPPEQDANKGSPSTADAFRLYEYLGSLRHLEITINKACPMTRQEFVSLFEARCWSHESDGDEYFRRSPAMRPLNKLEVHLGVGLDEDLADAVHERMILEGEEKGSRWFSWTRPSSAGL